MATRLPFEEFKAIYDKVPRLCVEIVIQDNDKILLTKRDIPPAKGYWHLPGGTLLKGESAKEAASRIAQDELGTDIKVTQFLGFIEYTPEMAFGQSVSLVFQAELVSNKITLNEQASQHQYFSTFPENLIPETRKFLEENVLK